jgi:hypothetical protein
MSGLGVGAAFVVLANLLYFKWRLEDEPSWVRRLVVFLMGFPFTFLTYLLVEPDPERAWRRLQRNQDLDDPRLVAEEFSQQMGMVRRHRAEGPIRMARAGDEGDR